MIVSNENSLLNILLPSDNKLIKEALKNADEETLKNIKNGTANIGDVLKNLFDDLKSDNKTNLAIENFLKNSNLFRNENLTKNISTLLEQLKTNPSMQKFIPIIETLLKDITVLDEKSLKQMIDKSGVFLEAKALEQTKVQGQLPKNIQTILNEIKDVLKNINTMDARKIETQIDNLKSSNLQSGLKEIVNNIKDLSTNILPKDLSQLNTLTKELQSLLSKAQVVESKINNLPAQDSQLLNNTQNLKDTINTKTLDILSQLKNEILLSKNGPDLQNILKNLDALLLSKDLFSKLDLPFNSSQTAQNNSFQSNFTSNINSLITSLKQELSNLHPEAFKLVERLEQLVNRLSLGSEQLIQRQQTSLQNDMKAVLLQMQSELSLKGDTNASENLKLVDKVINQIEYHQLLSLVSNSNSVYIPFLWDMLDEGTISMKKLEEDKFFCEINLSLKEFGQTNLLLAMYDSNKLDLTIYTSKDSFKQSIRNNLSKLKQALNKVEIIPVNFNIIDLNKEDSKKDNAVNKFNQNNINNLNGSFGIDIRV